MGDTRLCAVGVLVVLLLVAPLATGAAARPVAVVTMSGPHEVLVEGGEEVEFQVQVAARLECANGLRPPRDLIILPAERTSRSSEARLWEVHPSAVQVAWEAAPGEQDVYRVEERVSFNVTSERVPEAPVEAENSLLVTEAQDPRPGLHCQVDGYDLQVEEYALSFVVLPAGDEAGLREGAVGDEPPVRWIPMLLAVGILSSLAAFAMVRERQRRGR